MKQLAYAIGFMNKPANQEILMDELQLAALKHISANIMIADKDYNIVYVNDAIVQFLRALESDIRKDFPSFDTSKLIGTNIDVFHKNPGHQRGMLDRMNQPFETSIKVGGMVFNLRAFPVSNGAGARIGTVVEWQDSHVMDGASQLEAIKASMAVIEFDLDGTIREANENFLSAMGYRLDEI